METTNTAQSAAWKAYPVFIMYDRLCFYNRIDKHDPVDEIWKTCIDHYDKFSSSEFNNPNVNEYDCITEYVRSIIELNNN